MLPLDDPRWSQMNGGYRIPFDPRPMLAEIEAGRDIEALWHDFWGELYHQGDVGEASYATVPHLVRIHRQRNAPEWNTYALVAAIELAREERNNPELPPWLREGYFESIRELAEMGIRELRQAESKEEIRGILCILALHKGVRTYARFLLDYSEEELIEIESASTE
jgi:hypothetical protein